MAFEFTKLFRQKSNYDKRHSHYIYDLIKNIIAPGNRAFMSPPIQKIIDNTLDENLPSNWREDEEFRYKLIKNFSSYRFENYDNEYFSEYYAAYYIPNNFYKIQLMFLELFKLDQIDIDKSTIRILDIGSSTGTTSLALYDIYTLFENVLTLYGYKDLRLPKIEIDSVEKSESNVKVFKQLRNKLPLTKSIQINDPINQDITDDGSSSIKFKKYDIIFISNMLCELDPSPRNQLIKRLAEEIQKNAIVVIIDTAKFYDTRMVKQIQYQISLNKNLRILSPCGKINYSSERCNNCYSSRSESLLIPSTMNLLTTKEDNNDANEKLKWSYVIFKKERVNQTINNHAVKNNIFNLSEITDAHINKNLDVKVEIVSNRYYTDSYPDSYFIKVCDQTEKSENVILKVPEYYFLPYYSFGDVFTIKNVKVTDLNEFTQKKFRVKYCLEIDSELTEVINESTSPEPLGNMKFENIEEDNLLFFLKRIFGFERFNDGQFEILKRILENKDVLGILATGGGKSLTFQLPALLKPGVSVVISPLKSLMDDQVHILKNRFGLDFVDTIHSGISISDKKKVLERFRKGYLKILYISPERLQQKSFQKELINLINKGVNINYFPIDEAHCISEWGHDFRPAYARLKERQLDLPHRDGSLPAVVALTATASEKVREDILKQLSMDAEKHLLHRIIDRKELSLEVIKLDYDTIDHKYKIRYRDNSREQNNFITHTFETDEERPAILLHVLKQVLPIRFDDFSIEEFAGLIFTIYADPEPPSQEKFKREKYERQIEGARWLARYLRIQNINARPWFSSPGYRGDLKNEQRKKIDKTWEELKFNTQMDFVTNKINLLATTKGFGMGIDKPNIRYIIHYGFPGSMEAYFQQIGRAGRDRKHSHCILLWDSPTHDCKKDIYSKRDNKILPIPTCFETNSKTKRLEFKDCKYGRLHKCDFAKQIYFIESGYPSKEELESAIKYLDRRSKAENSQPWVYIIKEYLEDAIWKDLGYDGHQKNIINESLIIETLYTLNLIEDYSSTYLKVKVKRDKTWREILESTNNEIIHEHIGYFAKVYKNFLESAPSNSAKEFDIQDYILKLRTQHNTEILIDEVVQFFNIIDERNDVEVTFNYMKDFGYEIKLTSSDRIQKVLKNSEIKKVDEWKLSQYGMLLNLMDYCELKAVDESAEGLCRRANILTVFGTEAANMSNETRCNFCDNCGYTNPWDTLANNIIAAEKEQIFVKDIRKLFSIVSKNKEAIISSQSLLKNTLLQMSNNNYYNTVETISNAWNEQIGEANNPLSNFFLAITSYNEKNYDAYFSRIKIFIDAYRQEHAFLAIILLQINKLLGVDLNDIYLNYFYPNSEKEYYDALEIFNSEFDIAFAQVEEEIFSSLLNKKFVNYYRSVKNLKELHFHE